jgi:hypothetical protein
MALNLLLDRRLTSGHLDCRLVLLHRCLAAVLRRQRTVAGRSDWLARLDFGWAIRLTRHPRNTREVLLFGSWLEVPTTSIIVSGVYECAGVLSCTHNLNYLSLVANEWCLEASEDLSETLHVDGCGWFNPWIGSRDIRWVYIQVQYR